MILNNSSGLSAGQLPGQASRGERWPTPIMHFGVGGFHRAHQAWALQTLQNAEPGKYDNLGICGVCVLPSDLAFVRRFQQQDCLYFVQCYAPTGIKDELLVSAIREVLHPEQHYEGILERIADPQTQVISFTITEGGYNVDYDKHTFLWDTPAVQSDLRGQGPARSVFGMLARGLRRRMEAGAPGLALMSCDNVQHNGDILCFALLEFLKKYDPGLSPWVEANVRFIKTMVDRITPATSPAQRRAFEARHGFEDGCLVVCEDFFQWVIERDASLQGLPFEKMGAMLVNDVAPYEKMKLRLLNGGHSLTGLLGELLGYDRIHTSITDPLIRAVYQRYCREEVMDTLEDIEGVDYEQYMHQLVERFGNPMINDSTARIIGGSTDKLPKFVLPVILDQLNREAAKTRWGMLVIAAWYCYLLTAFKKDQMATVVDLNREELLEIFSSGAADPSVFWNRVSALTPLREVASVRNQFINYVHGLSATDVARRREFIEQLLESDR